MHCSKKVKATCYCLFPSFPKSREKLSLLCLYFLLHCLSPVSIIFSSNCPTIYLVKCPRTSASLARRPALFKSLSGRGGFVSISGLSARFSGTPGGRGTPRSRQILWNMAVALMTFCNEMVLESSHHQNHG